MRKIILFCILFCGISHMANAQKYFTRTGSIKFYSNAPLEKIEGHNQNVTSVFDINSGRIEFAVLIKAFQFEKALMQEHFNENYLESSKFPKSSFKGQIINYQDLDFSKNGIYPVKVKGDLTIHGVTHTIQTEGKFVVKNGAISAQSIFIVTVANYKIKIPRIVRENIAKTVKVTVNMDYEPLNKRIANK